MFSKLRVRLFLAFCILLLFSASSCDDKIPPLYLEVQNRTDETVTIRAGGQTYFDVLPHSNETSSVGPSIASVCVEGISKDGQIVYAKYFQVTDFNSKWYGRFFVKVNLLPEEHDLYFPLEIENGLPHTISVHLSRMHICNVEPGTSFITWALPPDQYSYEISALEKSNGSKYVFNTTYTQSELEQQNWKITIDETNIFQ